MTVTNVEMKACNRTLEVSAWHKHARALNGKTGDVRLDAITVAPDSAGQSVEAQTLNCSRITVATDDGTASLSETLTEDAALQRLTTQFATRPSREERMDKQRGHYECGDLGLVCRCRVRSSPRRL